MQGRSTGSFFLTLTALPPDHLYISIKVSETAHTTIRGRLSRNLDVAMERKLMGRPKGDSLNLTRAEIANAFSSAPASLRIRDAAALVNVSWKTLDEWKRKGFLHGTFRKVGRHNLFFRDRLIDRIFNGPTWPPV